MKPKRIARQTTGRDLAIYAAFFASGMAGLIYEISWSRQIGLLFGHTVHASAIVVACFFTGMAVGYALAARFIAWRPALRSYAYVEWIVAAWACLIPFLLDLLMHPGVAQALHQNSLPMQTLVRLVVCFLILLPATVGLGASLPFIAEYLSPALSPAPGRIARAYAVNTCGAILGVALATVVLFLTVGVRGSNWLAAALSALSGGVAYLKSLQSDRGSPRTAATRHTRRVERPGKSVAKANADLHWTAWALFSGFVALTLQVLYVHIFALVLHNSTYTFGAVLVVFLAGLCLAAAVAHPILRRHPVKRVIAWACMLGSLTLTVSLGLFLLSTQLTAFDSGESFVSHMVAVVALVTLVVGPTIVLLGLILPATWYGANQRHQGSGRIVGTLTGANTLASTLGSLTAAFLLIPMLGVWPSFLGMSVVLFFVGAASIWRESNKILVLVTGVLTCCFGLGVLQQLIGISTIIPPSQARVIKAWDTAYGRIDVVGVPERQWFALRENLHYVHGDTAQSADREFRQGHLPILLHRDPQRVLFLGLGTGMTAGAAVKHPEVTQIVAVELIPEVVEAVTYFSKANGSLLKDPRVEIAIDDARHWLLAHPQERFDIIVSDLFVPWQSKSGYLYTVEHYREVRRHLKPSGLFCQWLTFNQLGRREFGIIADSFASVFPVTHLWWGRVTPQQGMVMVVGSDDRLTVDGSALARRLERLNSVSERPDSYLRSVSYFCRLYAGRWPAPDHSAPLNTDEFPRVEFLSPITSRKRAFLTYQNLIAYFDQTLSSLHADAVHFELPVEDQETLDDKHAMQRDVLLRQMRPKR